ncbi:MAG: MarR family transcriptional regulator [Deltaproteobacteria bacterium]|nr:MarR family transcriptional regulator [Deltaproteobacteria bacterium]
MTDQRPEPVLRELGPLLFRAARLVNEQAIARVESEAKVGLRAAHTQVFPYLREEGVRLTELAERMGISKQAAGELVADLERMGVVRRAPDPLDGRAKLILVTKKGWAAFQHGAGVLRALEAELRRALGTPRLHRLVQDLAVLVDHLEGEPVVKPPATSGRSRSR